MSSIRATARKPRVFSASVPTTGMVYGPLEVWPFVMQDIIYGAMEKLAKRSGVKSFEIVQCVCVPQGEGFVAKIVLMEKLGPEDVIVQTIQ